MHTHLNKRKSASPVNRTRLNIFDRFHGSIFIWCWCSYAPQDVLYKSHGHVKVLTSRARM